jgi:AcrR family transcriptional regulator
LPSDREGLMNKPGRPPRLNREEAIHSAMLLFWERGYEGTTLEALLEAMGGIKPPSFYNAFGSKEELYRAVTERYACTFGRAGLDALEASPSVRQGIADLLRLSVENFTRPGYPKGCLVLSGGAHCAPSSSTAEAHMTALRQQLPETISARLRRAVTEADLDPSADIPLIAAYYTTVLFGIAQRAADGESRQTLLKIAEHAMDAWTGLAEVPATNPDQAGHGRPGDTRSARLSSWQMPIALDRSPLSAGVTPLGWPPAGIGNHR